MNQEWTTPSGVKCRAVVRDSIPRLVEILGRDAVVEFLLHFGGSTLTASRSPRESILAELLGREAVQALFDAYGARISVPVGKLFLARELCSRGESVAGIARRLHVTEATIRRYLRPTDKPASPLRGMKGSSS